MPNHHRKQSKKKKLFVNWMQECINRHNKEILAAYHQCVAYYAAEAKKATQP